MSRKISAKKLKKYEGIINDYLRLESDCMESKNFDNAEFWAGKRGGYLDVLAYEFNIDYRYGRQESTGMRYIVLRQV